MHGSGFVYFPSGRQIYDADGSVNDFYELVGVNPTPH